MRKPVSVCFIALALLLAGLTTSCMSAQDAGKSQASMSYEDVVPLPLSLADVQVINNYKPSANPYDVSSQFPTPPDMALKRYAERRLQPVGGSDFLRFVIEDARVHVKPVPSEGEIMRWLGVGEGKRYELLADLRIYTVSETGAESAHALMRFQKALTIPDRLSIAEREAEQIKFLKGLLEDIDKAVEAHLQDKMMLVSSPDPIEGEAQMPPLPLNPVTSDKL